MSERSLAPNLAAVDPAPLDTSGDAIPRFCDGSWQPSLNMLPTDA
jgi:hypothetical protein